MPAKTAAAFYRPELDWLRFGAFVAVFLHHAIPEELHFRHSHWLFSFCSDSWRVPEAQGSTYFLS